MTIVNSESFKYNAAPVGKTKDFADLKSSVIDKKIVVPLKYLSNFRRSLEISLISSKVHLEVNLIGDCILSSAGNYAKFEITNAKLHVSIVNFFTKDSVNLTKQLSQGFKRSFYWNSYRKTPAKVMEKRKNTYELLNASFQGIRRLFVLT